MKLEGQAKLLRIFIGEQDHVSHKPLFESIVEHARKAGMAGATVLRGVEGFGAGSIIHKAKFLEISEDLPFVIEIVDDESRIREFLKVVDLLFEESGGGGLVTIETVEIIKYTHPKNPSTTGK